MKFIVAMYYGREREGVR